MVEFLVPKGLSINVMNDTLRNVVAPSTNRLMVYDG